MLKKIIAISLFTIYLLNLVGYSVFFDYYIRQTNKHLVQDLDNGNYDESELFEIKVPLNLPYYTNLNEYERYDGEMELNGIHYNFVKRKVFNDTLYMLCLPNHIKTELYKAKNELVAKQSDREPSSSKKGTESFAKKNSLETDCNQLNPGNVFLSGASDNSGRKIYLCSLASCFIAFPAKPPEII